MSGRSLDSLMLLEAQCGMAASLCVVTFILGIVTCATVRRHHDPARQGFTWLYAAFTLHCLAFLLMALQYGLQLSRLLSRSPGWASIQLAEAITRMVYFVNLFRTLADLSVLASITGIATGIYHVTSAKSSRACNYIVIAYVAVVALMALAIFAVTQWLTSQSQRVTSISEQNSLLWTSWRLSKVSFTVVVLLLAGSVAAAGYVLFVWIKTRKATGIMSQVPLRLLVAAALLNLVIHCYDLVLSVGNVGNVVLTAYIAKTYLVSSMVVDRFCTVVVLALLFAIGAKKANGLWSTTKADAEAHTEEFSTSQAYKPHENITTGVRF